MSTTDMTVSAPASAVAAIAVGAINHKTRKIADFSGRGPTYDNRDKPDVVAPGVDINSVAANANDTETKRFLFKYCCNCCYDFYRVDQGTSFAAPHVAGVVALMFQVNPTIDALKIRQILRDTADKTNLTPAPPNQIFGFGIVDAQKAVDAAAALAGGGGGGGGGNLIPEGGSGVGGDIDAERWSWVHLSPFEAVRALALPSDDVTMLLISTPLQRGAPPDQHDRRVGALWQKCGGPRGVRRAVNGFRRSGRTPPGIALDQPVFRRLVGLLTRFGSRSLRRDISRFEGHLMGLLLT